jgi:PhoPQ-activated pathogenicity-related protein
MAAEPHAPVLTMTLHFSEPAVRVVQWTANNPLARDFRHPCGIEYEPQELALTGPLNADMQIDTPENGWNATFVETTFADGFVMTTPVQVTPMLYPTQAPPVIEPACKTLSDEPGR